jgi:hypothetical protein
VESSWKIAAVLLGTLTTCTVGGQEAMIPPPTYLRGTLHLQSGVPWKPPFPVYSKKPDVCSGRFLYMPCTNSVSDPLLSVWKINTENGEKETMFQVPLEFNEGYRFSTFAVAPKSGLVLEALSSEKTGEVFVLRFSEDGEYLSASRLDLPKFFLVESLAAFDTGQMFVSGYISIGAPEEQRGRQTVAIFSEDGELVRRLSGYDPSDKNAGVVDMESMTDRSVAMGEDGFLYYLRGKNVVVISSSGEVVRQFDVSRPEKDYAPVKVEFSEGVISISFMRELRNHQLAVLFRTYDATTGEILAEYTPGDDLTNTQLCYSRRGGYLFLGGSKGHTEFVRASP